MIGRNNPLNIRYSPFNTWKGQRGQTRGFCNFSELKFCFRAALIIIRKSYFNRGLKSYEQIISSWAPSSENNTKSYICYICNKCLAMPFDVPNCIEDFACLFYYMWCFEQGSKNRPSLSIADIEIIISELDLNVF